MKRELGNIELRTNDQKGAANRIGYIVIATIDPGGFNPQAV